MFGFLFTKPIPPQSPTLLDRLRAALRANARNETPINMDQRDTSFVDGVTLDERDETAECIDAVRSVPVHYAPLSVSCHLCHDVIPLNDDVVFVEIPRYGRAAIEAAYCEPCARAVAEAQSRAIHS